MDNDPNKGLRPPLQAFRLRTEPWLFVIDKDGKITARLEGSFGVTAFENALQDRRCKHAVRRPAVAAVPRRCAGRPGAGAGPRARPAPEPADPAVAVRAGRRPRCSSSRSSRSRCCGREPRLQEPRWRPLPRSGAYSAPAPSRSVCGAIGVALLFRGARRRLRRRAGGAGQLRADVHPDHLLGRARVRERAVRRRVPRVQPVAGDRPCDGGCSRRAPAPRPYPERLGRWPAALGLLSSPGSSCVGRWGKQPATLAGAALGYTVLTLAAQAIWGIETWTRRGEGFAVYFNLFSRISVVRDARPRGGPAPAARRAAELDPVPGHGRRCVAVMIGTVTFDGLSQGRLWSDSRRTGRRVRARSASARAAPSWPARSGCSPAWR